MYNASLSFPWTPQVCLPGGHCLFRAGVPHLPGCRRTRASAHIRFQWADGTVGRKQLGIADGLKWKADQRFKHQQGTTAPGTPTESSQPSADAEDAELKSSPPDAELESSPPSAPRNVAPSPSAQSGSNGLIEWSANSSESQTGSSGKPISGSNTNRAPLLLALRPSRVHRARMQRMQSSSRVHRMQSSS